MTLPSAEGELEQDRRDLAAAVQRFPLAVKLLRRSLFRQHLALNVTHATPLLDIVARAEAIDFTEAVWVIEPPRGWPARPLATDARATDLGIDRNFAFSPSQVWRRHRLAGVIVRSARQSDDMIGVRVLGDSLEITAIDGGLNIETFHGLGRILLGQSLPATISIAVCGRPVTDVVEHRWLANTAWPIIRVDERKGGTALTFDTGRADWSMPWPSAWQSGWRGAGS